ncbi:hypothetical protein I7I50_01674 [Histoplasma capsulatum G186AR]|uniref:Uncharacterized protein n=1 Tax=Ajellomyces capsulatus TaxID=5037 RepID=A0A8H7YED6_AJECA|nr:hypothetical protein I7I52_11890 [Histoplasma capsulatum]QSS70989.1 hypothetical protein I7I50_01674 [Histoplasma capsulatum G186AR]
MFLEKRKKRKKEKKARRKRCKSEVFDIGFKSTAFLNVLNGVSNMSTVQEEEEEKNWTIYRLATYLLSVKRFCNAVFPPHSHFLPQACLSRIPGSQDGD